MKTKMIILSAAVALSGMQAFADGSVTGAVFSKSSGEPLDFVSVVLVNPETGLPLENGSMTADDGTFRIDRVKDGKYTVRISMIGTMPEEREITVAGSDVNIGSIALADDARLLQEVVVTGQRSQVSLNTEKRVFNVSSNIGATGASAEELLGAVPSVNVGSDGEISLRGNSDVMVWINGKEMGMNADNRSQLLRQIPTESIECIEVMTNPSAKHSTEGTAGIINIKLKEEHRHGYFGSAEVDVDTHGSVNANAAINCNLGRFESFAGVGFKSHHNPGGMESHRSYSDGHFLNSDGKTKKHENSVFLRLGTNFHADEHNTVYLTAIGTLGHKWGRSTTSHRSDLPGQWVGNTTISRESGDTRGANIMAGYKHTFATDQTIDMSVSYNVWQGPNDNRFHQTELYADGSETTVWQSQHQDLRISNWEASLDYTNTLRSWLRIDAGYKGNYNHENSPASYAAGQSADEMVALNALYNRFKYDTDITALYVSLAGSYRGLTYAAGLRGEAWQIRTRSLGFGETDANVAQFKKNDFALFPSASIGWSFLTGNELKLNYSRRIHRPFGPQLNTFENISDPSEVHLGNPLILPEFSNAVELTYIKTWSSHMLSVAGYLRSNNDMISHVSFLAPMASDSNVNTMYYGHANVGNMLNSGVEIISRNTLFNCLTLTTTVNLYNSRLRAWTTDYPLHGGVYSVSGERQNRFVWDVRCMASVRLPWDLTFQATGRYNSRSVTAQGTLEPDWDVEAGLRKTLGAWSISLFCKDIFNSKETRNVLYGNGYTQSIGKWSGSRTLRLSVTFNFGKTHSHDHDHGRHNHIDTGGYGDEHHHHH